MALFRRLEDQGFDLRVSGTKLLIKPVSRLTPDLRADIRSNDAALITLVRICDEGVQERLATFKQQLREAPEGATPGFVFRRGTPYAKAVCFSCGAVLPEPRYGRCWRCSLAWRMSVGVPIPAELAQAYDESKVLA